MNARSHRGPRAALAVILSVSVAACSDMPNPVGGLFGGESRSVASERAAPTFDRPPPDSRGVITYATYQVMVARRGDTLQAMAGRVGLSAEALARHNGVPITYSPRTGEVFALPRNVGGTPVTAGSLTMGGIATGGITTQPLGGTPSAPAPSAQPQAQAPTGQANPFSNGQPSTVIDPIRHRVQAGETAFSIARLYGVSTTALASWNGLDSEMSLRVNQELLIPVINGANEVRSEPQRVASASPAPDDANPPGTATPIAPPPSAATPLPPDQDIDAATPPPSPNLGGTPSARFAMPVAGATVLRGYAPTGANRNEGIDFAAAAGTEVVAAADGEVALISRSVGGLGTILLIRHDAELMTVYGRISNVTLQKGDRVTRGQRVGVVAEGEQPNLHFEVRRGTAAVDPTPFLPR
ncbi:peptidoglycan DD-metalloendopeptidase family protein [Halovulum dunhuangense]|uniref:Peptidoglycan DD-metalloendopeptidase family protein n=1 Tax=Halovulum dunhuangense TaxID=1505036 RepID=A0A849L716_9RHOB|nr:peptidoglycan DD-metalloendopeptidase family protein [Halovulum dunhuangense]NNU81861.1 peptidoglycan DD-metalloendopeptidase family protein [Halovulum dunhuangense]